jgi:hypothetical protein
MTEEKIIHTKEDDFQHFLAYSGYALERPELIFKMRKAFFDATEPGYRRETDTVVRIDGKWYRQMTDAESAEFIWGTNAVTEGVDNG